MTMLINPFGHDELDTLMQELDRCFQHGEQVKLLLDGALHSRLLQRIEHSGLPWLSVFTQSRQGGDRVLLAASPLLLQCLPEHNRPLTRLLQTCDGLPMASFWIGQESLATRAQRFLPWCVVEADDMVVNLRYPDTRRLPGIVRVLDEPQRGRLFGEDSLCLYQARDGSWQHILRDTAPLPPAENVRLDARQTLALLQDAEADEILHTLTYQSALPPCSPLLRYQTVQRTLQQQDRQHITAETTRRAACEQALGSLPPSNKETP